MKRTLWRWMLDKPLMAFVKFYLSSPRTYKYKGLKFIIPPGIFHPGLFFSSKFLVKWLCSRDIEGKKVLDLGCGSGFVGINAAKLGAFVTACDINTAAVEAARQNAAINGLNISLHHSDLFQKLVVQTFDIIAINPPYFRGKAMTFAEEAWYGGENLEYFSRLFSDAGSFMSQNSAMIMVLSSKSEVERIVEIAESQNYKIEKIREKRFITERLFLFRIRPGS